VDGGVVVDEMGVLATVTGAEIAVWGSETAPNTADRCGNLACGNLACDDLALLASPLGRCDGGESFDVFFSAPGLPLDSPVPGFPLAPTALSVFPEPWCWCWWLPGSWFRSEWFPESRRCPSMGVPTRPVECRPIGPRSGDPLAAVCLGSSFGVVELLGAGWAAQQPSVLSRRGAYGGAAALGEALGGTIALGGTPVLLVTAPGVGLAWSGLATATGIHPKTSAQQPRMMATARRWRGRMGGGCLLVSLAISRSAPISSPGRCSRARMRVPRRVSGRSRTLRPAPKTRRSSALRAACRRSPAAHRRRGSA
jgi:hypothetical protein